MSHIFVSYKHGDFGDFDFLQKLEEKANSSNIIIWRDIRIQAGDNWETEIDSAIDDCFALLLLLTEHVSESQYVTYEWTRALTSGKSIIPVLLSGQSVLHPRLEKTQYIDFTQDTELAWVRLIARLSVLQIAFENNQQKQKEQLENESRRIYLALSELYETRTTQVTAEDILTELRARQYILHLDYSKLIDFSRKNRQSSDIE